MLRLGIISPLNIVIDYQRWVTSYVLNSPSAPKSHVSDDSNLISYEEHTLSVASWRSGLSTFMLDVTHKIDKILHGLTFERPATIPDDWSNVSRGYSWIHNADFKIPEHALLQAILKGTQYSLFTVDRDGELVDDVASQLRLLADISDITYQLAFLCYTIPGGAARITEFIEHKLANGFRPRTLFRDTRDLWLVVRRVKSETISGHESFIPARLPPVLQLQLERYLLLVLPLHRTLACLHYGGKAAKVYDEFLWVSRGERITAEDFRQYFPEVMKRYCGIRVGVHDYRQLVVQIAREYLGSGHDLGLESDTDVLAEQRGHSVQTARRHYSIEYHHLPSMSSDAVRRFALASEAWWEVVGFHPDRPPRLPLSLTQAPSTRQPLGADDSQASAPLTVAPVPYDLSLLMPQIVRVVKDELASFSAEHDRKLRQIVADAVAVGQSIQFVRSPTQTYPLPPPRDPQGHPPPVPSQDVAMIPAPPLSPRPGPSPDIVMTDGDDSHDDLDLYDDSPIEDILQALIECFPNQRGVYWRSRAQKHAVRFCLRRTDNLICILPCGGGKSLCWLIPAKLDPPGMMTVVIVPNKGLLLRHIETTHNMGISCLHWKAGLQFGGQKVLYVAAESVKHRDFRLYVSSLILYSPYLPTLLLKRMGPCRG